MSRLKRYALFTGERHYPNGGWNDFQKSFDTYQEALAFFIEKKNVEFWDWGQIIDLKDGRVISTIHGN